MNIHFRDEHQKERGVGLLLALFALILISAVGVAIVLMSTGETSIVANERSHVSTWEAAKSGLEEMRGRLSGSDAQYIGDANRPLNTNQVLYITNPKGAADPVVPNDPTNPYYDREYSTEWGVNIESLPAGGVRMLPSAMQTLVPGTLPSAPAYKWVRLTIKTEASANQPISCAPPGACNPLNAVIPITYDGGANRQLMDPGNPIPSPIIMVYRITSLAVLPNGSRSMVQYDLKRNTVPPFPGALTLCGSNVNWSPPNSNNWYFNGNDNGAPPQLPLYGIATCNPVSNATVSGNLPRPDHYVGVGPTPSVVNPSTINPCLQSVTCLNALVQSITASADQVVYGSQPAPSPAPPLNLGTLANPLVTVVADQTSPFQLGDLGVTNCSGAGILVVTGTLTCSGNSSFSGIILVIGQGSFQINGGGNGSFQGAFFVAKTRDASGNLLTCAPTPCTPQLGVASFGVNGGGANTLQFNSAYINQFQNRFPLNILASREIGF